MNCQLKTGSYFKEMFLSPLKNENHNFLIFSLHFKTTFQSSLCINTTIPRTRQRVRIDQVEKRCKQAACRSRIGPPNEHPAFAPLASSPASSTRACSSSSLPPWLRRAPAKFQHVLTYSVPIASHTSHGIPTCYPTHPIRFSKPTSTSTSTH